MKEMWFLPTSIMWFQLTILTWYHDRGIVPTAWACARSGCHHWWHGCSWCVRRRDGHWVARTRYRGDFCPSHVASRSHSRRRLAIGVSVVCWLPRSTAFLNYCTFRQSSDRSGICWHNPRGACGGGRPSGLICVVVGGGSALRAWWSL